MQLALVEGQLLSLQNVPVAASGLARSAGDNGIQPTSLELLLDRGFDLAAGSVASCLLLLYRLALLDLLGMMEGFVSRLQQDLEPGKALVAYIDVIAPAFDVPRLVVADFAENFVGVGVGRQWIRPVGNDAYVATFLIDAPRDT